jgi:hypothetical protein
MPQIPLSLAMSQLQGAGYSVRKSQARQDRLIVTRGRLTWSLAVLSECVARDRVTQLLDLAASQPSGTVQPVAALAELEEFKPPQPDRHRKVNVLHPD